MFVVSPDYNNFRFVFSLAEPYGLSKRWDGAYPETFADKFELGVFELNPTVSYKINKVFSVAAGIRMLHSTATVASDGVIKMLSPTMPLSASRFMQGDSNAWGYNLAVSVRPDDKSNISVTYRSNVDLDFSGNVALSTNFANPAGGNFNPSTILNRGKVTVEAPAVLAISGAHTFFDKLTVELTWDRTFWSTYKNLDFNYDQTLTGTLAQAFDTPITKNWKDCNAYRLGMSYKATKMTTLMAGFAYDETPVPTGTLGFELPDSNAYLFSLGARFKVTSKMDLGLGLLYDMKTDRTVNNRATPGGRVDGKFTNESAMLATVGMSYTF